VPGAIECCLDVLSLINLAHEPSQGGNRYSYCISLYHRQGETLAVFRTISCEEVHFSLASPMIPRTCGATFGMQIVI